MEEAKRFFDAYPEAIDILPVLFPQTVMQWTGEVATRSPLLSGFDSFPIAKREYSIWVREHLTSTKAELVEQQRKIASRHAEKFRQRIDKLLNSVETKTLEERIKDILAIRNEFFAYPVKIEKDLLDAFQQKQIDRWEDIGEEALKQNDPFRNYYREAIEYSQEAVPLFDQKKHLSPHFSGFVRNVSIMPERIDTYSSPIFEAQGAYIQKGKIIWSIHDVPRALRGSTPMHWRNYSVKWHSGNFVLEESYLDNWGRRPEQEAPKPASQERKATFQFNASPIKEVEVTQRLNREIEEFVISITMQDNTRKVVTANQSTHAQLIFQLKSNPTFLFNVDNVTALLEKSEKKG